MKTNHFAYLTQSDSSKWLSWFGLSSYVTLQTSMLTSLQHYAMKPGYHNCPRNEWRWNWRLTSSFLLFCFFFHIWRVVYISWKVKWNNYLLQITQPFAYRCARANSFFVKIDKINSSRWLMTVQQGHSHLRDPEGLPRHFFGHRVLQVDLGPATFSGKKGQKWL